MKNTKYIACFKALASIFVFFQITKIDFQRNNSPKNWRSEVVRWVVPSSIYHKPWIPAARKRGDFDDSKSERNPVDLSISTRYVQYIHIYIYILLYKGLFPIVQSFGMFWASLLQAT